MQQSWLLEKAVKQTEQLLIQAQNLADQLLTQAAANLADQLYLHQYQPDLFHQAAASQEEDVVIPANE